MNFSLKDVIQAGLSAYADCREFAEKQAHDAAMQRIVNESIRQSNKALLHDLQQMGFFANRETLRANAAIESERATEARYESALARISELEAELAFKSHGKHKRKPRGKGGKPNAGR